MNTYETDKLRHKVVFLGDDDSGRWELVNIFLNLSSWSQPIHLISNIEIYGCKTHVIEVWDVPYSFMSELTMKGTEFICLCFDSSSADGLSRIRSLCSDIPLESFKSDGNIPKIIVIGCNEDRLDKRIQYEAKSFMIEIENFFKVRLEFFDIATDVFFLSTTWESSIDELKCLIAKIIEGETKIKAITPSSRNESINYNTNWGLFQGEDGGYQHRHKHHHKHGKNKHDRRIYTGLEEAESDQKRKIISFTKIKRKAQSHDCNIM